jgi:hypothetical protein
LLNTLVETEVSLDKIPYPSNIFEKVKKNNLLDTKEV